MSRWSESRGVYDDVCYLRQAHLFERFGLRGIDTNLTFDDDHYLKAKLKEIGFPEWNDPNRIPCHTYIPASDKYVLQYPPGTGFVLSLFPAGFQAVPLYVLANVTIFAFALFALFRARETSAELVAYGAEQIGRALGVDWAARVDFIVRDGRPFFLECDAAPLVGPDSAFAASFAAAGVKRATQLAWLTS
jgi:hypothetical protein